MKNYLNISEIGALFGLSVQTLHYYDRIGLFQPACRDSGSNYRRYRFDQIYQLASIRCMRKMGYSIEEVQQFLDARTPDRTIALLKKRSQELRRQWEELIRVDEAISRKIRFIEQKRADLDVSVLEIRRFPERWYIPIGGQEQIFLEDSFYFYPTIAFYEEGLKYFGAYIDTAAGVQEDGPAVEVIPAGRYLVGFHQGAYEHIQERFIQMRSAHPELRLGKLVTTFNIIDQFVECDSSSYVTEIQMLILE